MDSRDSSVETSNSDVASDDSWKEAAQSDRHRLELLAVKWISSFLSAGRLSIKERSNLSHTIENIERVTKDLAIIETLLSNAESHSIIRQRALYYMHADLFKDQRECDQCLEGVLRKAKCKHRMAFGIAPHPKGLVAGSLYQQGSDRLGSESLGIDYCLVREINWSLTSQHTACVVVVEKDTIFQQMVQALELSKEDVPIVLITGRGYPDIGTRRLLGAILRRLPHVPMYFFGDFDPDGYAIYLTYKYGPIGTNCNVEAERFKCPPLMHAGLWPEDIDETNGGCIPVRNAKNATRLRSRLIGLVHRLLDAGHLDAVEAEGLRAAIQDFSKGGLLALNRSRTVQHLLRMSVEICEFEILYRIKAFDLAQWFHQRLAQLEKLQQGETVACHQDSEEGDNSKEEKSVHWIPFEWSESDGPSSSCLSSG